MRRPVVLIAAVLLATAMLGGGGVAAATLGRRRAPVGFQAAASSAAAPASTVARAAGPAPAAGRTHPRQQGPLSHTPIPPVRRRPPAIPTATTPATRAADTVADALADRLARRLGDQTAAPVGTSGPVARPLSDANFCFGPAYTDSQGDGGSFLDAQSFGLVFDCSAGTWFFGVQTFDHWPSSRLHHLFLDLDTDGNLDDHCYGMDWEVDAGWTGSALAAVIYRLSAPDADGACAAASNPVSLGVGRGTTLDFVGVAFPASQIGNAMNPSWFGWIGDNVENADYGTGDFVPDEALADADASSSTGCTPSATNTDGSVVTGADAPRAAALLRAEGITDATATAAGQVTFHADADRVKRVLAAHGLGGSVAPNYLRRVKAIPAASPLPAVLPPPPNDYSASNQWGLAAVNAEAAWAVTHGSASVKVADLDSGVDFTQPDLQGKLLPGYDVATGTAVAMTSGMQDALGHGTATAGVLAAATNNGKGLASLGFDTKVLPIRLSDDASDAFADSAIAVGLRLAADQGAQVINMSFGAECNDPTLASAIAYAQNKGALLVAAAGNEDVEYVNDNGTVSTIKFNPIEYPAAYPGVLAVGATGHDGSHAVYSNEADYVRLVAPGGTAVGTAADDIDLLCPTSGPAGPGAAGSGCVNGGDGVPMTTAAGTSFSTPLVSAAAALVLAANPSLSPTAAGGLLISTAADKGPAGYDITFGAGLLDAGKALAAATSPTRGVYHSLTPARILDTRDGSPPAFRLGALASAETYNVRVAGVGGVPATGVSAVVVNAAVTQPTSVGYVSLFPSGPLPSPETSNLTYAANQTVANLTTVKVGLDGFVSLYAFGPSAVHVILDVVGWYDDGSTAVAGDTYLPLANPQRILDTRDPNNAQGNAHPLGPNSVRNVTVVGVGGVPASGVDAVVFNVTVTNTTGNSYLTVWPAGQAQPLASTINWPPGGFIANQVIAKVGTGGQVSVYNLAGNTDVIVDVAGYYTTGAGGRRLTPLPPARVLDTRTGTGPEHYTTPIGPNQTRAVTLAGQGGIPASGVQSVVMNITVTPRAGKATAVSYLTAWPADQPQPFVSSLLWPAGATVPDLVTVKLSADGKISIYNLQGNVDVIIDVFGYF